MLNFVLGTAQFSNNYGLTRSINPADKINARKILNTAHQNGIRMLDTAASYKNALGLIGDNDPYRFKIFSKFNHNMPNFVSMVHELDYQLKMLSIDHMEGLLCHDLSYVLDNDSLVVELEELKRLGKVKYFGVSIYSVEDLRSILKTGIIEHIDIIQFPLNPFNTSVAEYIHHEKLLSKKILFSRSIYLQGFLLQNFQLLPKKFLPYKNIFTEWKKYLLKHEISALEACLNQQKILDNLNIIFGCYSSSELNETINASNKMLIKNIPFFKSGTIIPKELYDPRFW